MTRGRALGVAVLSAVAASNLVLTAVRAGSSGTAASAQSNQRPPARTPDIHFVPTQQSVADAMLQLARVNANDVVYDLGSGDGRIVITAAQKYGARGVGIELDPRLVRISRQTALEGAVEHKATFIEGDLFTADISPATVVTLYLSLTVNMRLEAKLKRELRPGVRIVSQRFPIGSWQPDATAVAEGEQLFLWRIPG
jgi:SAM-dependent methyltransferase